MKNLKIDYKYNEDMALKELCDYIDSTYDEHYSKNKFQATEFIIDGGHGEGFVSVTYSRDQRLERRMVKTVRIC